MLLDIKANKVWVILALILFSNKYNITSYWNNTNNSNSDKNSSSHNNCNSDKNNKNNNCTKIIYIQNEPDILVNLKIIEYFGYY